MTVPTTIAELDLMIPEKLIKACQQPVAIGPALMSMVMIPINAVVMFTVFTKMNEIFDAAHTMAKQRPFKY